MTTLPTSLSNLNLTTFNKIYPLLVQKYSTLIPDPNANTLDKINSIIDSLNSMGKLSNDVVDNWNKVMAWVMNDGLNTDVSNKIDTMVANGTFDQIFQQNIAPSLGNLSSLQTGDKSNIVNAVNEVDGLAKGNQTNLGTLANLQTTVKTDLVSAVNETDNLAKTNQTNLGTLSNLHTIHKTDLVSAVNDNVAQLADLAYDLTQLGTPNGSDWTQAFQNAVNAGYKHIYISQPISITTVNIPYNQPIKISASNYINISGNPLITILSGGSGLSFNGSGANLCTGIILEGLSFTSNNASVNSAIKATNISGFFFKDLYFGQIKGSAIQTGGIVYDGGLENIHMLDCGDTNLSAFKIGDSTTDANRISTRNLRIERTNGLALDIQGNAYAIEFQDTKLHGSSNGKGLLAISNNTYGIRFNGGQFHITSATDTIQLYGIGNKIDGVTFTSNGTDISGVITLNGQGNKIENCTFNNLYGKVLLLNGESHDIVNNTFYNSGWISSSAPFSRIDDNHFISPSATTGQTGQLINVSNVGVSISRNKCKNAVSALDAFIGAFSGKGATIKDNYDFGSAFAHMLDINMTNSVVENNGGTAITSGAINDSSGGSTNTNTNNRLIS